MERPPWAPAEADLDRPSVARVYDFYLGGSHNFESDRAFAQEVLRAVPDLPAVARDNRAFLRRAVRYLCDVGLDQFLDLGSGIPSVGNVHEVARRANPTARVVYVDRDPVAVVHSRLLLEGDDLTTAVLADVRDAPRVLDLARGAGLDLDRPVAVLAVSLLHFLADDDCPAELMARYLAALPPGSHLAVSHSNSRPSPEFTEAARIYARPGSPQVIRLRTPEEIAALFGDLELVPPGLVHLPRWRPDPGDEEEIEVADDYPVHGGVGRKP